MVPQKASGGGGGGGSGGRGGGGGRIPHFNWSIYRGGNFFSFFFESGLKLDEKSIEMVSKVRNFWLCVFSGVVATTLIHSIHDTFCTFFSFMRNRTNKVVTYIL